MQCAAFGIAGWVSGQRKILVCLRPRGSDDLLLYSFTNGEGFDRLLEPSFASLELPITLLEPSAASGECYFVSLEPSDASREHSVTSGEVTLSGRRLPERQ